MMLIFGPFNTLSVKWADTMTSESVDGTKRPFNHPFLQATGMFLGEMLCMLAFWVVKFRASRQQTSAYPPLTEENAPKKFNPLVSMRGHRNIFKYIFQYFPRYFYPPHCVT